jgi:Cft2 family RNA processing exonuclease
VDKAIINFYYQNGLEFNFPNNQKIIIDGTSSKTSLKAKSIVSHAHSDHNAIMHGNLETYATKETIDLFLCQNKTKYSNNFHIVDFNKEFKFLFDDNEVKIKFLPSGHILGSASVLVEYSDSSLLFSSDIGGKGLLTVNRSLETANANILVVEATFGSPELHFPPREEIKMDILKWAANIVKEKRNVVFSAGKIGSAQELIKLFNDFSNLRIVTHGDVTPICDIYKSHGINLEYVDSKSEEGREYLKDGECIIIQPRGKKTVPHFMQEHVKTRKAIVTGMVSRFRYKDFDQSFPLSSHANFKEIIEYVSSISPELIFTVYGYDKQLAKAITKELDIPAVPLKEKEPAQNPGSNSKLSYEKKQLRIVKPVNFDDKTKKKTKIPESLKKAKTLDDFFSVDE